MRRKIGYVLMALAAILFILTIVNASWMAPRPGGAIRLIAHRGVSQLYGHDGLGRDTCTADRIEPPVHDYIENTVPSMAKAIEAGADMVEVDIAPTADGKIALFHDWTVDCRTQGHGETRSKTLAELQALDPGYGYTADGGKTFPLRGIARNRIPTLEEGIAVLPHSAAMYNFKSKDAGEADLLAAALKAAKRDPIERRDGFYGAQGPVDRIRALYPGVWAFSLDEVKSCAKDYLRIGWAGIMPNSCKDGTVMVPIDRQWAYWGWPDRFLDRMAKANAHVVMIGPMDGKGGRGLSLPEQLGQIPSTFKGYVWVEDIWTVGPSLRPGKEVRNQAQLDAAEAGLKQRRARLGVDPQ